MASTARKPGTSLYDVAEVKDRLTRRIDDLVRTLYGGDATSFKDEYRLGSAEGGPGESCVVPRSGSGLGTFFDHNPASRFRKGDLITLIAAARGITPGEAIRWAASYVGMHDDAGGGDDEDWSTRPAGADQLARRAAAFWRTPAAIDYFRGRGLTDETLRRFHLGISAPYHSKRTELTVSDAACAPLIDRAGSALRRFLLFQIPGLTQNAPAKSWCAGEPRTYYASSIAGKRRLLVAEGQKDLWILAQLLNEPEDQDLLIISSTHGSAFPKEWGDVGFWANWTEVYFGHDSDEAGDEMARKLGRLACRDVRRIRIPDPRPKVRKDWTDYVVSGAKAADIRALLAAAPILGNEAPAPTSAGLLGETLPGEYEVAQVNVNGAYVNGRMYYPFQIESIEEEVDVARDGTFTTRRVASYRTKVVRSDGKVLDIIELPAPRGTPKERRVMALTDGTRIIREPQPNHRATWPLRSINRYIARVRNNEQPARSLETLTRELREHFESAVWLPNQDDHTVLALYTALTFIYTVFDAIPLMLITGEKGTGKTALGEALEAVSFNATLVGRTSAATAIRAANESRGLMILDDLEAVGTALADEAFSDIHQMLKLSYKKTTGRKIVTDKAGRTIEFDFFGPKVVNNTTGIDPITLSRMYEIRTRKMPADVKASARPPGYDPNKAVELRQELHCWAMSNAKHVESVYRRLSADFGKSDRFDEISLPLRVLAHLANDNAINDVLERALQRQARMRQDEDEPNELLKEAVHNIVRQGATREISLAQLCLELRLSSETGAADRFPNNQPIWRQSWWISNQLSALDLRDHEKPTGRRRLYGRLTKIFSLPAELVFRVRAEDAANGGSAPAASDPFEFCTGRACPTCPYSAICPDTLEGVRDAKSRKA
jgi:hypothetical protein